MAGDYSRHHSAARGVPHRRHSRSVLALAVRLADRPRRIVAQVSVAVNAFRADREMRPCHCDGTSNRMNQIKTSMKTSIPLEESGPMAHGLALLLPSDEKL